MTGKRFIEFATQNTDNGEINNGFHDIKTGEWYYTKDSENAKKICDVLNELHEENQGLQSSNLEYEDTLGRLEEKIEQLKKENNKLHTKRSSKMIKFSVPCKCGGTLKRHSSYTGHIYWYCSECNRRIEGDEFND